MTTSQKTLALATVVTGIATLLVVQHNTQVKLRAENHALRQQLERLEQLSPENTPPAKLAPQSSQPAPPPNEPSQELLRLRGEAGLLRRQNQELAKLLSERPQTSSATDFIPSSAWTDSGNTTPESAANTFAWAIKTGNKAKLAQVLAGAEPAATNALVLMDEVAKALQPLMSAIDASRLLLTDTNTPDQVTLWFQSRFQDGQTLVSPLTLQRAGSIWKVRLVPGEDAAAN